VRVRLGHQLQARVIAKHLLELRVVDLEGRPACLLGGCLRIGAERGCSGHAGTAASG
jgi:hypothetical protein